MKNNCSPEVSELETRCLMSIGIDVRYDYDTSHFFDTQAKQNVMQRAADTISGMLTDELAPIAPSGDNHWLAMFPDPSSWNLCTVEDLNVPADTMIVFVGGCNLGPGELGMSIVGNVMMKGSPSWFDLLRSRGQAGALSTPPTDFGPWGGTISFNSIGVNWYFGQTTASLQPSQYDFYSTALHELGHIFGYGDAESWQQNVCADLTGYNHSFHGVASMAAYGGVPVPLADGGHWAMGVTSEGVPVAMDPADPSGERHEFTRLDFAGLTDIGWSVQQNYLRFSSPTYTVREDGGVAEITVIRVGDTSTTVSVHYATADVTAQAGADYTAVSGTLTFGPGETSKTFDVPISTDSLIEQTEGLNLVLSDPVGISTYGSPSLAALRIIDVPPPVPSMSISDVRVLEGAKGTTTAYFTVSLSAPYPYPVTVFYGTGTVTAPGIVSATAGTDFVPIPPTVLTFSPGEVSKRIAVRVKGDRIIEPDETFCVNLWSATHAIIVHSQALGTILNDDTRISINNVRVNKPSKGTAIARFTVQLSSRSPFPVTVTCATSDGTATAGSDYTGISPMTLTFKPGETRKTVSVRVIGNRVAEPNETFYVKLSNPANAVTAVSTGVGTIVNPHVRAKPRLGRH
jgi:hypothetical protein